MNKKVVSFLLIFTILIGSLSGCAREEQELTRDNEIVQPSPTEISVTVVDGEKEPSEKEQVLLEVATQEDSDIEALVYSAVDYDLQQRGYSTRTCMAVSSDETYSSAGIGYFFPEFKLFSDDIYAAHGFVTVVGPDDVYSPVPTECDYVLVEPIEGGFDNGALYNLFAYTCESIEYGHFIFDNNYVVYYQLDSTTVKYETYENKKESYDLSIGSLYDFDNEVYVYDASLFDGYETHSALELFSEEDYSALENELHALSEAQKNNGYYIEELEIVYISPESIQAYLEGEEEDTFFGYSVKELEQSLGFGTALVYTEKGLEQAEYYNDGLENYDWKSFLIKVGIGAGIVLIGATVTTIATGVTFGCALVSCCVMSVSPALIEALGVLAVETVIGMIQGQEFADAINRAAGNSLDTFANTFIITAAITSVGMATGIIKPFACFVEGTKIAAPSNKICDSIEYRNIEDIVAGDMVLSYDVTNGMREVNYVTTSFVKSTGTLVHVSILGETLSVTEDHPFYDPVNKKWTNAGKLCIGDKVLLYSGEYGEVENVEIEYLNEPCDVFNFTVENNHTYFVGENSILVHNSDCLNIEVERRVGVKQAWQKEKQDVINGKSRYNWTKSEIKELLETGKVRGYDGCHIIDVHINPKLAANPDNIIFLKHDVHIRVVHGGNTQNPSRWGEIIKLNPKLAEQVKRMGGLL